MRASHTTHALVLILSTVVLMAGCDDRPEPAETAEANDGANGSTGGAPADGGQTGAAGLVALEIDLPDAQFKGTPTNFRVENLLPARKGPRTPLLVPAGVTNVALNQPVSSSDSMPIIGTLDLVTDGDKEAMAGAYVELGFGKQWVQVDLGRAHEIFGVVLWHYHGEARVYHDVVVQISSDPSFEQDVTTVFNNDHDNSLGLGAGEAKNYVETNEGKLIDAGGAVGQYVRCWSQGNTSTEENHYTELEVYGRPVE